MDPQRYEKIFLSFGAALLVIFLAALAYAAIGMGIHLPGHSGGVDPRTVRQTPPFDSPGVRQVAPGRYEVVLVGHAWAYEPNEIHVPPAPRCAFVPRRRT